MTDTPQRVSLAYRARTTGPLAPPSTVAMDPKSVHVTPPIRSKEELMGILRPLGGMANDLASRLEKTDTSAWLDPRGTWPVKEKPTEIPAS